MSWRAAWPKSCPPPTRQVAAIWWKIDLPGGTNSRLLRSRMYGKARFTAGQKQAITTPQAAVVERGQLMGVYVVDGG
ncbi:MAG TPA: hypothetical protein VNO70_13020, partial [Blastocatellia bacterium]|nr:hypothetical protein [Blastocatellia bacterium]